MPAHRRITSTRSVASLGRSMHVPRLFKRSAALAALGLLWLPVISYGDLEHDLAAGKTTAAQLRASIAAETRRIQATSAGVAQAQARLAGLQGLLNTREAQLTSIQGEIVAGRKRLERLENRLHDASKALASTPVASYKDQDPDVVTVVLEAHGFADMLERLQFMERIRHQDTEILGDAKTARAQLLRQTSHLQRLLARNRALAEQVQHARDAEAAVQGALLARQAEQLQRRATTTARLSRVRG